MQHFYYKLNKFSTNGLNLKHHISVQRKDSYYIFNYVAITCIDISISSFANLNTQIHITDI